MQGNEQRALLLHLATMAEIPMSVMDWLINHQVIESMFDLSLIPLDEIQTQYKWIDVPGPLIKHEWYSSTEDLQELHGFFLGISRDVPISTGVHQ